MLAQYSYDAWGKILSVTGSNTSIANDNPFRYRGYFWDDDLGLYYLQSRYYDPVVCRFISPDSASLLPELIGDSLLGGNLYAYCGNNPIGYVDPSGCYKVAGICISPFFYDTQYYVRQAYLSNLSDPRSKGTIYVVNSKIGFKKAWNGLETDTDILIINMHGSNNSIGTEDKTYMRTSDIKALSFKRIRCIIILACNSAHSSFMFDNVACAFSRRISGVVVGSDGTVYYRANPPYNFWSKQDDTWLKIRGRRGPAKAKGWLIYRNKGSTTTCYSTTLKGELGILTIISYLKNVNMF